MGVQESSQSAETVLVTTVRCPSCDAAVPADASWCTLCFARLDAAPAAAAAPVAPALPVAPAPVAAPVAGRHAAPSSDVLTAPVPGVDPWVAAAIAEAVPVQAEPQALAPVLPVAPPPPPVAPLPPAVPVLEAPVLAAPAAAVATATVEAPTWPCSTCGHRVAFDLTACPDCGMPFMGGVSPQVSLRVPGVGELTSLTPGMKFAFIAGGAALITGVLVLLFLVLGHIF